jgi:hypothetical protein
LGHKLVPGKFSDEMAKQTRFAHRMAAVKLDLHGNIKPQLIRPLENALFYCSGGGVKPGLPSPFPW